MARWRYLMHRLSSRLARLPLAAFCLYLCLSGVMSTPLAATPVDTAEPKATDVCPVCGMFVAKYPEWVATVQYTDGHAHHFDGAKDLFKYLLDLPRYAPGDKAQHIRVIAVTEYYGLTKIDARQAFYVVGSDVIGPMGHELVPLASRQEAEEFTQDHGGRRILTFDEVDGELLKKLDQGQFD